MLWSMSAKYKAAKQILKKIERVYAYARLVDPLLKVEAEAKAAAEAEATKAGEGDTPTEAQADAGKAEAETMRPFQEMERAKLSRKARELLSRKRAALPQAHQRATLRRRKRKNWRLKG